jgi:dTDP-4-dehydrorhamnose reductase
MRLAVTGRHGQVAAALIAAGPAAGVEVIPLARPEVDLANPASVARAIHAARPDIVVNAAAWTAVDLAETQPAEARRVNADGAAAAAAASAKLGVPVIQLSTDCVFDGRKEQPYIESDPTAPLSVYGATKLEGERHALAANPDCTVVRLAWVYAHAGRNFIKAMLGLGESRDEVAVVADQFGNPTSASDIAAGLLTIARNLLARPGDAGLRGVFHLTAAGEASRADLAEAVFALAAARGRRPVAVRRIATSEYRTPAARPSNSRLDCALIAARHGVRLPHWRLSLEACMERLLARKD